MPRHRPKYYLFHNQHCGHCRRLMGALDAPGALAAVKHSAKLIGDDQRPDLWAKYQRQLVGVPALVRADGSEPTRVGGEVFAWVGQRLAKGGLDADAIMMRAAVAPAREVVDKTDKTERVTPAGLVVGSAALVAAVFLARRALLRN